MTVGQRGQDESGGPAVPDGYKLHMGGFCLVCDHQDFYEIGNGQEALEAACDAARAHTLEAHPAEKGVA